MYFAFMTLFLIRTLLAMPLALVTGVPLYAGWNLGLGPIIGFINPGGAIAIVAAVLAMVVAVSTALSLRVTAE